MKHKVVSANTYPDGVALIPFWVLLGIFVVLLNNGFLAANTSLTMLGILQLLFGIQAFWTHGGQQITAAGVYSLSSSVFVGFAAIWYAGLYGSGVPPTLFTATTLCYFSHMAMYSLFWRSTFSAQRPATRTCAPARVTAWLGNCGTFLVVLAVAANAAGGVFIIVNSTAFAGALFLVLAWLYHPPGAGRARYLVGAAISVVLYITIFFAGYGRLFLATFGIVLAIIAARHLRGRSAKLITVAAIPGALVVFGAMRVAFLHGLYPSMTDTENGGIDSVINPLLTFSQVIQGINAKTIDYSYGSSFLATSLLYVPRWLWADKPIGFGAVLANELLVPGTFVRGTSLAALSPGEWFHNFGFAGIVLMVIILGFAIRWLDVVFRRVLAVPLSTRKDFLALAATIVVVAGTTDLVWVGTFTFYERSGTRLFVILAVAIIFTDVLWRRVGRKPLTPVTGALRASPRAVGARELDHPTHGIKGDAIEEPCTYCVRDRTS